MQIAGIALITTFLVLVIKEQKPTFAFLLVLFTGTGIFLFLVDQIQKIIMLIENLAANANVNMMYVKTILKIIGIAYIAEFAAHISKDAGLGSMAAKVELAGKILILALAVPILTALVETIIAMMPVR
ncbi:stage III sporulation protein AD [Lederbergia citrea]|uniref:Stage III sporulation protein AD n=1 Tax=Lederbergia citrea TaxID=2833581 RepID=A0A942Z3C1_9BACI|nr:stage III sporulation protein AD [Lederbergia citrea]MBS4176378.1 stage III sporulation protein AD [Lederbergia citrea]MBS4202939.1 stage III sporulation protein AD [Lederbergia citrea]MBS4222389.1 stage III sporulation protein AD [Lederbergia citrea]